jgi:hypothetical protein
MVGTSLGMGDQTHAEFAKGYWLAGIGRVWAPTQPYTPRSHGALRLPLTIKLDSTASAMIEYQVAITPLLEGECSQFRTLTNPQAP